MLLMQGKRPASLWLFFRAVARFGLRAIPHRGDRSMFSRATALMLSGAIGLLATGCTSTSPTFRGQSPNATPVSWGGSHQGAQMCPDGMCQPGGYGQTAACPPGQSGNACNSGHCNLPFHPVHRNFHTYSAPGGLMYPAENAQPAVYQYPYYTLRGPTDFFMK